MIHISHIQAVKVKNSKTYVLHISDHDHTQIVAMSLEPVLGLAMQAWGVFVRFESGFTRFLPSHVIDEIDFEEQPEPKIPDEDDEDLDYRR